MKCRIWAPESPYAEMNYFEVVITNEDLSTCSSAEFGV